MDWAQCATIDTLRNVFCQAARLCLQTMFTKSLYQNVLDKAKSHKHTILNYIWKMYFNSQSRHCAYVEGFVLTYKIMRPHIKKLPGLSV